MTPMLPDDPDLRAGEYVLGLLGDDARAAVERDLASDSRLRNAVAFWQTQFVSVADVVPPLEPDPKLWPSIERGLSRVAAPRARQTARAGFWESLAFWRWASAAAVAASIALLAVLALIRAPAESQVVYVAVLEAPDRTPGWIVQAAPGAAVRLTPLVKQTVAANQSLQFWTLIDRAQGPVSLGLVEPNKPARVSATRLPGLKEGQLFEITLEPYGGSPINRPTGAVLYKGLTVETRRGDT